MKKKYLTNFKSFVSKCAKHFDVLLLKDQFAARYNDNINEFYKNPKFVNLGAGSFFHPTWINMDYENKFYKDIQSNFISHDLSKFSKFPFEDGEIDAFYSSHVIEHLNDSSVEHALREVYRTLKFGGTLRLVCPDMEYLYLNYLDDNGLTSIQVRPWGMTKVEPHEAFLEHFCTYLVHSNSGRFADNLDIKNFTSKIDKLDMEAFFDYYVSLLPKDCNQLMPEGHCNWFSYRKLHKILSEIGFKNIARSEFGKSGTSAMRSLTLFDNTSPEISLYVEAIK